MLGCITYTPITISLYIYYRDWLRTNGVNTNGAAAKVMKFDRLGKKVRPGTLGKISRLTGGPKKCICQKP